MEYDFRREKKFGYTTGSCATAGAYAGLYCLKKGTKLDHVEIINSKNETLIIPIEKIEIDKTNNKSIVTVKKFAGEDIDITNGVDIVVEVELSKNMENGKISGNNDDRVIIIGGQGIGTVTKDGLQIKKGEPAINPKPREMIKNNLLRLLDENEKVVVKISVPKGEELAKKTLNPKLGIVGGISILGTTGIVRPMSNEAYRESLVPQIDVALANGYKNLIFTPGNIGTKYAKIHLNANDDQIVEVSNFWGYMLDKAAEKGVKEITIFGHSGKIVKLAGGIFDTHSKVSDARNEILTAYSCIYIDEKEILEKILYSNTTEEIITILNEKKILNKVFNRIAKRVVERLSNRWEGTTFKCIIIDMKGNILGRC